MLYWNFHFYNNLCFVIMECIKNWKCSHMILWIKVNFLFPLSIMYIFHIPSLSFLIFFSQYYSHPSFSMVPYHYLFRKVSPLKYFENIRIIFFWLDSWKYSHQFPADLPDFHYLSNLSNSLGNNVFNIMVISLFSSHPNSFWTILFPQSLHNHFLKTFLLSSVPHLHTSIQKLKFCVANHACCNINFYSIL